MLVIEMGRAVLFSHLSLCLSTPPGWQQAAEEGLGGAGTVFSCSSRLLIHTFREGSEAESSAWMLGTELKIT